MNYYIIYPESHDHLGLFEDLKNEKKVKLIVTAQKKIHNRLLKKIRRIHLSATANRIVKFPFRKIWYKKCRFDIQTNQEYCIIILDAALKALDVDYLNQVFAKPNVCGCMVLINSMDAGSVGIQEIKSDIWRVRWNAIYTFDPEDARKYSFSFLGNCYYSMHDPAQIMKRYGQQSSIEGSDAYFSGGLKGGREETIFSLFSKLNKENVKTNFHLSVSGMRRIKEKPFSDLIHYHTGGWIPYEEILAGVLKSNVIIEILQNGQSGPSLRYYEAVCYNKKLLTNNRNILYLPYYDERYMKIIEKIEDIDVEWIRRRENIDYHYHGDFSPVHLLNVCMNGVYYKKN